MSTAKAPAAPSDRICEKHGKATRETASRQWKNVILLKAQRKNMRHNGTTIFHYVHCASLSVFNVLTRPYFVL